MRFRCPLSSIKFMIPYEGYCIILYSIADFHLLLYTRSIPSFNPVHDGAAAFLGYYSFSQAVEAWPHLISQAVDLYLLVWPAVRVVHANPDAVGYRRSRQKIVPNIEM